MIKQPTREGTMKNGKLTKQEIEDIRKNDPVRQELLAACTRLSKWVAKGVSDGAFVNSVIPKGAERALAAAHTAMDNAEA